MLAFAVDPGSFAACARDIGDGVGVMPAQLGLQLLNQYRSWDGSRRTGRRSGTARLGLPLRADQH
jgi:hypothetical protein